MSAVFAILAALSSPILGAKAVTRINELSKRFSNLIRKGDIIYFYGEIGVGKTTFIKHLINNLQSESGLNPTEVPSPTFNIVNQYKINLVIIGPEQPLVDGIVDYLNENNIKVFGPNKIASQLEGSKTFTKELCKKFPIY